MAQVIEVRNLHKAYDGVTAVDDVSFNVGEGEIFGIIGPSWISTPQFALNTLIVLHVWQFGSAMVIVGIWLVIKGFKDRRSLE